MHNSQVHCRHMHFMHGYAVHEKRYALVPQQAINLLCKLVTNTHSFTDVAVHKVPKYGTKVPMPVKRSACGDYTLCTTPHTILMRFAIN